MATAWRPEDTPKEMLNEETDLGLGDSSVLVVVLNDPTDLARAIDQGWYRIPMARAPRRVAAEYLAFYQTGAFPTEERWAVRWLAPIHGYRIASRRDLIPEEPDHPRSGDLYYRISIGQLQPLPHSIPSRRLRRITFIPTTLDRLFAAQEINDLWVKSTAQERLWAAIKDMDLDAERQFPLNEDRPDVVVDFALLGLNGGVALILTDEPGAHSEMRETPLPSYWPETYGWTIIRVTCNDLDADPTGWAKKLARVAGR